MAAMAESASKACARVAAAPGFDEPTVGSGQRLLATALPVLVVLLHCMGPESPGAAAAAAVHHGPGYHRSFPLDTTRLFSDERSTAAAPIAAGLVVTGHNSVQHGLPAGAADANATLATKQLPAAWAAQANSTEVVYGPVADWVHGPKANSTLATESKLPGQAKAMLIFGSVKDSMNPQPHQHSV